MPLVDTPETPIPRYTHAVTTKNEGDGNDVVYDRWIKYPKWEAVWDKFSYENQLRKEGIIVTSPGGVPDVPSPPPPSSGVTFNWRMLQLPRDGRIPAREYSYWPHTTILDGYVYAFCCSADNTPRFFRIDANGDIFDMGSPISYRAEGEGWYWLNGEVYLIDGPRLRRVNPFNGDDNVVFDVSEKYANHNLWQAHSSLDGKSHVATVRENNNDFNPHIATAIAQGRRLTYVPAMGEQDEAHMSGDGNWAVIEEDNNNRIVSVKTGAERLILDADYALSHIDCGLDYMVGEDNIHGRAWRIDLATLNRIELEQTWGMGHVSVQNGKCLLSNAGSLMWMDLNGGGLTHILDHGMIYDGSYDTQVKANLDSTATVALFMTNDGVPGGPQVVKVIRL